MNEVINTQRLFISELETQVREKEDENLILTSILIKKHQHFKNILKNVDDKAKSSSSGSTSNKIKT
jgi:hypothetical protein